MKMPGCRIDLTPTDEQVAMGEQIKQAGGSMRAIDLAHSDRYSYVGSAWSRARAEATIREMQADGKWLSAHAHDDGTIYLEGRRLIHSAVCKTANGVGVKCDIHVYDYPAFPERGYEVYVGGWRVAILKTEKGALRRADREANR